MKKIIFLLIILHSIITTAQKKHTKDFTIGFACLYPTITFIEGNNPEGITRGNAPSPSNDNDTDLYSTPVINGTFKYAIKNNWFLNTDIGFYQLEKKCNYIQGFNTNTRKRTYITVGVGTEYHYLNRSFIQLYSGLNIAYTVVKESHKKNIRSKTFNYPDFQLNILGVRVGKKIAGTFELGYGYKGIVNFGISFQID